MKRTIEKLNQQRRDKEENFKSQLEELKKKGDDLQKLLDTLQSIPENSLGAPPSEDVSPESEDKEKRLFPSFRRQLKQEGQAQLHNENATPLLNQISQTLEQNLVLSKEILSSFTSLLETTSELMDAKDKEWDALGSNHVGMIFKSMEWRVDKLAAESEDARRLMKKFFLLKERLNELLALLEEKKMPSPSLVKDILAPLEDWRYTGFENRYRGTEEETAKKLEVYVPYFKLKGKVLDLGCGRGEFLSLLDKSGLEAEGVDLNQQMVDICRDKGLNCTRTDILDTLAGMENGSLGGIFSAQVIEHLPPEYLKRVIELAYHKLAPEGYLILETINPTSVFALVQIYYLDLSHRQPIHPQALKFLMESSGFSDIEIKFSSELLQEKLQNLPQTDEASEIANRNFDKLNNLLFSAPNYAAIGKKT